MSFPDFGGSPDLAGNFVWRLESAGPAPGIDLLGRLAGALGTVPTELLPQTSPPDTLGILKEQAKHLFDQLLQSADRETMLVLNALLTRLAESGSRG